MKSFKDTFKAVSRNKKLSDPELATMLGVVPAFVSRLKKGFSLPSNDLLVVIAKILELNLTEIYLQVSYEKTENERIKAILENLYIQQTIDVEMNSENKQFIMKYKKLDEQCKTVVRSLIDAFKITE